MRKLRGVGEKKLMLGIAVTEKAPTIALAFGKDGARLRSQQVEKRG